MYLRPGALSRPRIVVVEHDSPTLSRLCGLLQAKGYRAIGVDAAPDACRLVDRQRVDLVLTTIALPAAEREAWVSALGRLDRNVPVIAMCEASSAHALDLFDTANEFGATAVLRRPFTATTLLEMLKQLLPAPASAAAEASQRPTRIDWPGLVLGTTAIH